MYKCMELERIYSFALLEKYNFTFTAPTHFLVNEIVLCALWRRFMAAALLRPHCGEPPLLSVFSGGGERWHVKTPTVRQGPVSFLAREV